MLQNSREIGKLLFAGFREKYFTSECDAATLMRDHHVRCFILQIHNFVSIEQFMRLINDLQGYAYKMQFDSPLIIAINEETYNFLTRVVQIKELTLFPTYMALTATRDINKIFDVGKAMGIELKSIGINMVFGPSLDICSKVVMDVIGTNSFGVNPDEVIRFGGAFLYGLKEGGLIINVGHFPGIGKSYVHRIGEVPVLLDSLSALESFNCLPFKKIIEHNLVDSVLVSTVLIPNAVSKDANACLNPKIVDGMLRNDMNFDKLVIAENIEVQDLYVKYGIGQAASIAIAYAHCDMVMVVSNFEYQLEALEYLSKAFSDGNYQSTLINAIRRIDEFLGKVSWSDDNIKVNSIILDEHRELAITAFKKSITLVKNLENLIPLKHYNNPSNNIFGSSEVLIFTPNLNETYRKVVKLLKSGNDKHGISASNIVYTTKRFTSDIKRKIAGSWMVILFADDLCSNHYILDLIKEINDCLTSSQHLVVVSADSPYYFFNDESLVPTFICTYGDSYEALKLVPELIFGNYEACGVIPGEINKEKDFQGVLSELSNSEYTNGNDRSKFEILLNKPSRKEIDIDESYKMTLQAGELNTSTKMKIKSWVVEEFDGTRDSSLFNMLKSSIVSNSNRLIDLDMFTRTWEFTEYFSDFYKTFVVRNPTLNLVYGMVVVIVDDISKIGHICYMMVSKGKRRQGVGEALHQHAIKYMTIDRNCTTILLGCTFPMFSIFPPNIIDEIFTVLEYLRTKNQFNLDVDDVSMQLIGFFKSFGWSYTRQNKGLCQLSRKILMILNYKDWTFPMKDNSYEFLQNVIDLSIRFDIEDDATSGFNVTLKKLRNGEFDDYEEMLFPQMYSATKLVIEHELKEVAQGFKRNTFCIYARINGVICGGCIVYTSHSRLSLFYPFIEHVKGSTDEVIAGITGFFINYKTENGNKTGRGNINDNELIKLGILSACIEILHSLGIDKCLLHNIHKDDNELYRDCGFQTFLEYCACYGSKQAFEWIV